MSEGKKMPCSSGRTLERGGDGNGTGRQFFVHEHSSISEAGCQEKLAVSPKEAAKLLGIGHNAVYALCHRADFPAIRVGERSIIIPVQALREWLAAQAGKGGD